MRLVLLIILLVSNACTDINLDKKNSKPNSDTGGGGTNLASCFDSVSGLTMQSGESKTFYLNSTMGCGQSCDSSANKITKTCSNGNISTVGSALGATSLTCSDASVATCSVGSFDSVPFINLTTSFSPQMRQYFIDYLVAQSIPLTQTEKNIILNDNYSNPSVTYKFKFQVTGTLNIPTNLNYDWSGNYISNSVRYLLEINLGGRIIRINNQTNPIESGVSFYIGYSHSDGKHYRFSIAYTDNTSNRTLFEIFGSVKLEGDRQRKIYSRISADIGGHEELDLLATNGSLDFGYIPMDLCHFMRQSLPAVLCQDTY